MKVNAMSQAHMIRALQISPLNCAEIADASGLNHVTVREYMRAFHKVGAVHIHMWEKDSLGRDSIKVYALGEGKDAKRKRMTDAEKQARYKSKMAAIATVNLFA